MNTLTDGSEQPVPYADLKSSLSPELSERLNRLGFVDESDPLYKPLSEPPKTEVSWGTTLEALRKNNSPKAQALYMKMVKKYGDNLKREDKNAVDSIN